MAFNEKYDDLQHKGNLFATQALEKLQDGDMEGFKKDWEEANKHFKLLMQYTESDAGKLQMVYGESLNFGIIMDVILENANKLYEGDKSYKKAFQKIVNEIKKDKVLKEQFELYNTFTNKALWENQKSDKTKQYVDNLISMCETYDRKTVSQHNKKLIGMIKEYKLNENVMIDDDTMKLYESIECIMFNNKKVSHLHDIVEAKENIEEYLNEHVISNNKPNIDFEEKLSEITEKYEKELNDDEKRLIEKIENSDNKEKLFNEYKTKTLSTLSECLNKFEGNDRSELQLVIEKINNKTYNDKSVLVDISEMIEVMNVMGD